jgi:excisionase family DNA binding protein
MDEKDGDIRADWVGSVPVREAGPAFYRPGDMPKLLNCSRSTYYRIVAEGHLPYARLYPGGPRVHLKEHVEVYRDHLLSQTQVGEKPKPGR